MPSGGPRLQATAAAIALLPLAACSSPGDTSAADASPGDAAGAADAGDCRTERFVTRAAADAVLVEGQVQDFGELDVINVGVSLPSLGIFRFDVSGLPRSAELTAAELVFSYAATSISCSDDLASCESCERLESSGTLFLHAMRSDWNEATARYDRRRITDGSDDLWQQPGASGDADRSPRIGVADHQEMTSTTVAIDPEHLEELGAWRTDADELSFLLAPTNGATFVVAARESAEKACTTGGFPAAELRVDFCP